MRRNITDNVLDTFDTFNEKVSESYEEFDKYNDVLEKYTDIVDLLGVKTDNATRRLVKSLRDTQL
jgi:Sec7-like guanine-nucleotide exchange factor